MEVRECRSYKFIKNHETSEAQTHTMICKYQFTKIKAFRKYYYLFRLNLKTALIFFVKIEYSIHFLFHKIMKK